jgi:predicted Zn finger-like uncharacterized protein
MKIVCDSCGTKYSISDEKVRGKVFKIRCKKCSHIIVVRGTEDAAAVAAAPAPAVAAAPAEAGGWHLVVEGDQVGPVPEADIRARIERGEINAETYLWKEGFADWLKLSAIPEFAHLVTSADGGVFADGTGPGAVNGDAAAHEPATGGLFGGVAAAAGDGDVFGGAAPARRSGGGAAAGDLFASPAVSAKSASDEPRWPASSAAPATHDGGRIENLTGQRHENSVLFSLSNLQSLAMPAPASKNLSTTAPTSEGSGLIDIRAMAATTLGASSGGGSSFGGGGPVDDLPAFGAFSPAAPVLLALPSQSGPPKWIYPLMGGIVVLVGIIGFMAFKILNTKPVGVAEVAAPAPAAPEGEPGKPSAPVAAAAPAAAAPSTIPAEQLPPREAPKPEGGEAKAEPKAEHEHHHKGEKAGRESSKESAKESGKESGRKSGGDSQKAVAAADSAPAPVEKKAAKGSLDDLLEGALNHKSAPSGGASRPRVDDDSPRASSASSGPLAKGSVVAGMNSVKGKIGDCYQQFKVPGMAMVNVVIGKSGRVSSATVSGKFAGTPTGSCVERAVKTASFPPSDGLTTPYPFMLK